MIDVIGIGHACFDNLCIIPDYPKEDTATRILDIKKQGGGAVSQALVTLSRLGCRAAYVGTLADDEAGKFLLEDYNMERIDTSYVSVCHEGITSTAFVLNNKNTGDRTIFYYPGKLPKLEFDLDKENFINKSKILHLDATDYDAAFQSALIAKKHKVMVSLDGCEIESNVERTIKLISLTDVLITNKIYPFEVTGCSNQNKALLQLAEMGPKIVVMTCGADGCLVILNNEVVHFPAYKIEAIDTTGAGDAFHGAFLYGILQNYSIEYTIKFASAVSAINCLSIGGRKGLPNKEQVLKFLESHEY